jgi:hypothetical protein
MTNSEPIVAIYRGTDDNGDGEFRFHLNGDGEDAAFHHVTAVPLLVECIAEHYGVKEDLLWKLVNEARRLTNELGGGLLQ